MGPVAVKQVTPAIRRAVSPNDLRTLVVKAFGDLSPENPIKKMPDADCETVLGALMIFAEHRDSRGKSPHLQALEQVAQVVSDAAKLSVGIKELFRNDYGEALNRRLMASQDLPGRLDSFMIQVGGLLYVTGFKKQHRAFADYPLIYASELVRLRTGSWNDEHLQELFQTMRPEGEKFSGDAIHKKRERFKAEYPVLYRIVVQKVLKGETLTQGTLRFCERFIARRGTLILNGGTGG